LRWLDSDPRFDYGDIILQEEACSGGELRFGGGFVGSGEEEDESEGGVFGQRIVCEVE
jgi:hypothetical protein